jgi:type IV pilus assembly protein PilO
MAINFNAVIEDFKRTNWNDPGTWSLAPKLLVVVLTLVLIPVAGYFLDTQSQLEELERGKQAENKLKEEWVNKKKQAINLDLHKQQLREINESFGALLKQLPDKSQMAALLVDINQAGLGRGLQFEMFRPGAEILRESFAELPIDIRVTGSYHDMGAFASDVGQLSRIVTLNDVAIDTAKDGSNLNMNVIARTFRYLNEEETSEQKKAQQAAKKGPANK